MRINDITLLLDLHVFGNSEGTKLLIWTVIFCLVFTAPAKWRVELRAKISLYRNRCFICFTGIMHWVKKNETWHIVEVGGLCVVLLVTLPLKLLFTYVLFYFFSLFIRTDWVRFRNDRYLKKENNNPPKNYVPTTANTSCDSDSLFVFISTLWVVVRLKSLSEI